MKRIMIALCLCALLMFSGAAHAASLQQTATPEDMQALQAGVIAGHATTANNRGLSFEWGQGAPRNFAAAALAYRDAAEQGDANGQYNLGRLYEFGGGLPRDYALAAEWYRRSAEQGLAQAQARLGVFYDSGLGVPRDYAQAEVWYKKAAEQGYVGAQTRLLRGPPPVPGLGSWPFQILILAMTIFCLLGDFSLMKNLLLAGRSGKIRPAHAAAEIDKLVSPEEYRAEIRHHRIFAGLFFLGAVSGALELALNFLR